MKNNIPRMNFKDIEINGRNFRLNKLDARTGSYMLFKLTKILTPLLKNLKIDDKKADGLKGFDIDKINLTELAEPLFSLPEEEFRYIQDNCLRRVEEILPAGATKVLNKLGEFEALDIEYDTALVMNLTVQSLMFNVSGFLEGSPLASMLEGLSTSQQSSEM